MATIDLRNVRKSYDQHEVIHGVDVRIADGEFIVIVGPSGCGKSTLLRMVAGLEEISAGEIAIDGRVVNDIEPAHRDIAMVFQNYALYPHMSVFDNMAYGLKIRGTPKDEIRRRVDEAAAMLELGHLLERRPRQLSGGQRQRVAMGRALVRAPKAFLFDEPLSNLDAKLRVQMRLEIQKLHRRLSTTSLFVTHDQVEAMTLAQRMIVMNAGRVEQVGTPHEVYQRPATTFVAGFIGSPPMNLVEGRLEADGLRFRSTAGEFIELPQPRVDLAGRALVLGIRPEHLLPADDGLVLTVQLVESLGAESLIHARLGEAGPEFIVRAGGLAALSFGELVSYRMPADALHWFDAASGLRVD
ncbi:sn-glycerol-3-phosphate import ATP-binding protein UgpC [Uliginosibacterium sp. H1]|uniref:sn-glycerol-3-phosphate import ATP-binding protein UgpC n=1 Tax=Uliginosibacterium sp. H1 TaxID=3114757 RepID=UPI002E18CB10|nr:sn-glycerol-3-phosphate import ATP-binding protein UgpC [Uliginosibacterium sp. H1]